MLAPRLGPSTIRTATLALALGAMAALGASGCQDSCSELADRICRCERSESLQSSCLRRVDSEASTVSVSVAEQETCEQILDSGACSCDALASGNYEACGLATQPPPSLQSR